MEKLFQLKAHGTNVRTEILAGITTFMTMAYIMFVNPGILSATGMDKEAVFVATILATAIATFIMAFVANVPFAVARAWDSTPCSPIRSAWAWAFRGSRPSASCSSAVW
jgi:xanthine/uracil/vitamin C permease (AzgA family)